MFKDINNLLRQAYDVMNDTSDKPLALSLIYQALELAKQTENRVLRAHVVQCSERVRGTL